jgi:hypothetical protein
MRTIGMTGQLSRVVRRPRQKYRRIACILRHDDNCMQLHTVAHRDHYFAANVFVTVVRWFEIFGCFGGEGLSAHPNRRNNCRK